MIYLFYLLILFLYELSERLPDYTRVVDVGGSGGGGGVGHLLRDRNCGLDHPEAPLLKPPQDQLTGMALSFQIMVSAHSKATPV